MQGAPQPYMLALWNVLSVAIYFRFLLRMERKIPIPPKSETFERKVLRMDIMLFGGADDLRKIEEVGGATGKVWELAPQLPQGESAQDL